MPTYHNPARVTVDPGGPRFGWLIAFVVIVAALSTSTAARVATDLVTVFACVIGGLVVTAAAVAAIAVRRHSRRRAIVCRCQLAGRRNCPVHAIEAGPAVRAEVIRPAIAAPDPVSLATVAALWGVAPAEMQTILDRAGLSAAEAAEFIAARKDGE